MMLRSEFNCWLCVGGFGTPCARGVVSVEGSVMDVCSVGGMSGGCNHCHEGRLHTLTCHRMGFGVDMQG
jgi:hypothetical protein